ncbi:RNA polymerase sigma factor [Nesterenkonia alba]|uniref:RNA polymerase sigma factor n=1 Tax=Nesterenkonia alba TaxID=515814 RepID=UPI0003B736CA|nr:RNA polymerase sigma factor [Nesterenkonia alba]
MSEDLKETLHQALRAGDQRQARRLTQQTVESGEYDDALRLLAQSAPEQPWAAELLIEALDASGVVRRFARAALVDQAAVDDVAQDALISVASSISSYDGRGKVTTWVHSIVRRRVVDHLRRQRSTAPLSEDVGEAVRMSSMIATRATVQEALASLPELYREPVVLRDMEGRSYAEIAERLGRAQGTVKAQISRGRAMVAAHLREDAVDDDQASRGRMPDAPSPGSAQPSSPATRRGGITP